jgi:hypothetical protein
MLATKKINGETSLTPMNFHDSCKYLPMFKTSHLSVSNFGFLSLCPFRIENVNFISKSKTTPFSKRLSFSFEIKNKIGIPLRFYVRNGQSGENQNLIHLSERFWTL